jgi:hypothetical protein
MKHLFRAGLLLLAVLVLVFIVPRVMPTVASLSDYGFHPRQAGNNAAEWASLPISYAQSSACLDCHKAEYTAWQQSSHQTVACENCHGPAEAHLQTGVPLAVDTSRELCGTCHARLSSRPSNFPQVDMNEMGGQAACTTCHSPHDPRAGMPPKVPHTLEGRSDCQSCHNPHEPLTEIPPQVPHTLVGRTNCLSCHGSEELKKITAPQISHTLEGRANCLVCHNTGGIKPFPADHAGRATSDCLNCHGSK